MIFNLHAVRAVSLLAMLSLLGACSHLPSFTSSPEPIPEAGISETESVPAANDLAQSDVLSGKSVVPEISQEQLIVQALSARPNLFALSKRTLASDVKAEMIKALGLFQTGDLSQSNTIVTTVINNELNLSSSVYVFAGDIALAQMAETDDKDTFQQIAIEHYQKALSVNPDNAKAANRLAKLMREQGEFAQAHELYSQAIAAQAMHANSYRNRAVLRDLYLNQKALALQDYQAYAALLQYQQEQSEQGRLMLAESDKKLLKKDLKIVKRWLIDLGRQVSALAKAQEKAKEKVIESAIESATENNLNSAGAE